MLESGSLVAGIQPDYSGGIDTGFKFDRVVDRNGRDATVVVPAMEAGGWKFFELDMYLVIAGPIAILGFLVLRRLRRLRPQEPGSAQQPQ